MTKKYNDFRIFKALRDKVDSILQTKYELFDKKYLDTVLKDYNYVTLKL